MNDYIRKTEKRRSIRRFKPDMPDRADIELIVEAGLYAPSGMNRQATVTLVVTDKAKRDEIAEINRQIGGWQEGFDPFYGAPVILLVLADKSCPTSVYDGSLVMGNMLNAAHSLGLGSIWIHRAKEEFEQPAFRELLRSLGIEGEWEGIGHCAVGFADCDLPEPAPRRDGRVFWIE